MAGYTPSKEELRHREAQLFEWYRSGMSRTKCMERMKSEWGIGNTQAGRWMNKAQKQLRDSISEVDRADLMSQMIEMLQDAAQMARDQKNPTGVSACIGQLAKLTGMVQ